MAALRTFSCSCRSRATSDRRATPCSLTSALPKLAGVVPAAHLGVRPTPQMVSSGVRELDHLIGGLPRGCLTEICGPASSGRTSLLMAVLAAATQRHEVCALVDVSDALAPSSAAAAGVDFEQFLWVRCGTRSAKPKKEEFRRAERPGTAASSPEMTKLDQALRATDLLLQSGGFGLVAIDLGDVSQPAARRVPLTSWFRFQRAVENTRTVLFVVTQSPCARTCASLLLKLQSSGRGLQPPHNLAPAHTQLLEGLRIESGLLRSRLERKPMQSATSFVTNSLRVS